VSPDGAVKVQECVGSRDNETVTHQPTEQQLTIPDLPSTTPHKPPNPTNKTKNVTEPKKPPTKQATEPEKQTTKKVTLRYITLPRKTTPKNPVTAEPPTKPPAKKTGPMIGLIVVLLFMLVRIDMILGFSIRWFVTGSFLCY
jgi:hypothetical protein